MRVNFEYPFAKYDERMKRRRRLGNTLMIASMVVTYSSILLVALISDWFCLLTALGFCEFVVGADIRYSR